MASDGYVGSDAVAPVACGSDMGITSPAVASLCDCSADGASAAGLGRYPDPAARSPLDLGCRLLVGIDAGVDRVEDREPRVLDGPVGEVNRVVGVGLGDVGVSGGEVRVDLVRASLRLGLELVEAGLRVGARLLPRRLRLVGGRARLLL